MVGSALGGLSETRRKLIQLVKASRELTVDELSDELGITKSAVRQHVAGLEAAGLLDHIAERGRPGRPRFRYILTPASDRLFPGRTDEVFAEVLTALDEGHPGLTTELFKQHFSRRTAELADDIGEDSVEQQVAHLVRVLEEDGHMPVLEANGDDTWTLTSANCPLGRASTGRPEICHAELAFIGALTPSADVICLQRIGDGQTSCIHQIAARSS